MSKKRTSPESSNDEQTNEDSDSVFQQEDNAKRVKLSTLSDTTLQDLPMELIECILVKAVAMEVEGMKLAKSVWKEKAYLVISRLGTVCPQWNYILTTDFFRNELHRTLDRTAQKTIRLEMLHQSPFRLYVCRITTIKDEIFILCLPEEDYVIHVYDRNNVAKVKDVIPLPGIITTSIAACSVSNCVYLLCRGEAFSRHDGVSIRRITKVAEHKFNISPFISDLWMPDHNLLVTAKGSVILSSSQRTDPIPVISIYNANGSLQHEIRLSLDLSSLDAIIPKSDGNLVLVSYNDHDLTKLTEIDMDGSILRQYQSSLCSFRHVCPADIYGRIVIDEGPNSFEILDSEFNLMDFTCSQLDILTCKLHYNSERNELVSIDADKVTLNIYHFIEE